MFHGAHCVRRNIRSKTGCIVMREQGRVDMNEMYEERFRKNGCFMVLTAFAEISGRRPDAS